MDQHCEYFQASPDKKTHCVFRPLEWWVDGHADSINFLCFPELTTSFSRLIEPFCDNSTCALPKRNPSNHSELYGGRPREHGAALDAFARRWYSKDLELYERHCGTVKGPRFCRCPLFFTKRLHKLPRSGVRVPWPRVPRPRDPACPTIHVCKNMCSLSLPSVSWVTTRAMFDGCDPCVFFFFPLSFVQEQILQ